MPGLTPEAYARWRTSCLGHITETLERELIFGLLGDVAGKTMLEIGCGDGQFAVELARRGAFVTAIDASGSMIAAARDKARRNGQEVEFITARADALPFGDRQFDIVVAVAILCFVKDADPVFQEIARVMKPKGHVVIGELGKWSSWALERRVRAWFGSPLWKRGVFRTPDELRELARRAGLSPKHVKGAIYYPRSTWLARILAPYDTQIGRVTPIGAAFLGLRADKPPHSQTANL